MKTNSLLTIGAVLVLGAIVLPAQNQKVTSNAQVSVSDNEIDLMRKDLRDQKKQIVAANMPMNGDEAAKFWPLYDAYTQETIKLNDERYSLVQEYVTTYSTMTDAQAASFIRRWIGVDEKASQLRLSWIQSSSKQLGRRRRQSSLRLTAASR